MHIDLRTAHWLLASACAWCICEVLLPHLQALIQTFTGEYMTDHIHADSRDILFEADFYQDVRALMKLKDSCEQASSVSCVPGQPDARSACV